LQDGENSAKTREGQADADNPLEPLVALERVLFNGVFDGVLVKPQHVEPQNGAIDKKPQETWNDVEANANLIYSVQYQEHVYK